MCHGADGAGKTFIGKKDKLPDLRSTAVQKKADRELSEIVENSKQKMSAFKGKLKPEQIRDLVGYIHELAKSSVAVQK